MALLDDVKLRLRITNVGYDDEISDLITEAKADLNLSGILASDDTDALIKRCIMLFVKLHFGWNNKDHDKLLASYNSLKEHLALSQDYAYYKATFTITDESTDAIQGVKIVVTHISNNKETVIYTDSSGVADFYLHKDNNYVYNITKSGYESDLNTEDEPNYFDLTSNATINITLGSA